MKKAVKTPLIGMVTGFANGLFGAGGGTLLVPAMKRLLGIDAHRAHATAIAVILPLSVMSAFVYARNGNVDIAALLWILAGGLPGGYIGAKRLKEIPKGRLRKIFGAFMAAAALRMIL